MFTVALGTIQYNSVAKCQGWGWGLGRGWQGLVGRGRLLEVLLLLFAYLLHMKDNYRNKTEAN